MEKGKKEVHLSVRQKRELDRLNRRRTELIELGDANPKVLVREYAEKIVNIGFPFKDVPSTLVRKVYALVKVMAIPKSPRGRKPLKQHAA